MPEPLYQHRRSTAVVEVDEGAETVTYRPLNAVAYSIAALLNDRTVPREQQRISPIKVKYLEALGITLEVRTKKPLSAPLDALAILYEKGSRGQSPDHERVTLAYRKLHAWRVRGTRHDVVV